MSIAIVSAHSKALRISTYVPVLTQICEPGYSDVIETTYAGAEPGSTASMSNVTALQNVNRCGGHHTVVE